MVHDDVVGVIDIESDQYAYFTDDHVRMLNLLAPQIASSVENARLYEELALRERRIEQDLQAARELQSALLATEAPRIGGLDIAIGYRPARDRGRRPVPFLRVSGRCRVDHHRRRKRQGRGRGALRRAGERPAAHDGARRAGIPPCCCAC